MSDAADDTARLPSGPEGPHRDYRVLWEATSDAVLIINLESGRILEASPGAAQVFERPADQLRKMTIWDLAAPEDHETICRLVERTAAEGHVDREVHLHYPHPSGELVFARARVKAFRQGAGPEAFVLIQDLTDVTDVQQRLEEAETRYRTIFETAADAIFLVGPDGVFLGANPAAARAQGLAPDELAGKHMRDLFPPEIADRQLRGVMRVFETGRPLFRAENITHTVDGPRWFNTSLVPVTDSGGTVQYVVGLARDVTDSKEAEDALRESEARYRAVVESQTELVTRFRPDGTVTFVNEANCRYFGLTREEFTGKTFKRLLFPEDYQRLVAALQSLTPEKPTFSIEHRIRRGDEIRWTQWTNRAIFDEDGRVVEYQGVGRDITERRQAEQAYRALVERSIQGIVLYQDYRIVFANRAFAEMLGRSIDELLALSASEVMDLTHPADRDRIHGYHRDRLADRPAPSRSEYRMLRKDGSTLHVAAAASMSEYRGRPAVQVFYVDITERRQLEEQLREAQKMEAVGQLAGGIAHDFNNLMTGILCQVDLLARHAEPGSPVAAAAEAIEGAAQRAAHRTKQLLGFARRGKLQNVPVDLAELVEEVISLVHTDQDGIAKPTHVHADRPRVMGDPEQLEQVLLNLALNARDAMPEGGEMAFDVRLVDVDGDEARRHPDARPGRYVRLAVSDTGCGIGPDVIGRIFEPFFTTKEQGRGTGMGLATVYGIVRNHAGWVEVDSEPGRGSEFRIYLPPADESAPAWPALHDLARRRPTATARPRGRRPSAGAAKVPSAPLARVLVVDDEEIVRRVVDRMLRDAGYEVVIASNGTEAVAWYHQHAGEVDLAIIDMRMPRMDGRECFRELRRINPEVRAIFSTGFEVEGIARAAIEDGMVGFVRKPFHLRELTEAVSAALGR